MKKIIALLLALVMAFGLVACGQAPATDAPATDAPAANDTPATDAPEAPAEAEKIALKVWGPNEDQTAQKDQSVSFLEAACKAFDEAHPEWDIEFVFEVCGEGDAGNNVTKDVTAAGDVYAFASDQLGTLGQANAIARLGGAALEQVQNANYGDAKDQVLLSVSDVEGAVYGVPFTPNTYFMYYDKSVYTEEDIKSLDAMMAKKPVAFPITNTWNLPAFYFAVGGTMYGDGTDEAKGVEFGGEAGAAATLYIANALKEGKMFDDANGAGKDMLKNGQIGAMFTGTWDAKNISDILGENYAAAQLPCITVNGAECQLKSFNGTKAYAANPTSKNLKAATALAAWLGSAEMQKLHYELRNGEVIPVDVSLADIYTSNPAAIAQENTMAYTSTLQPNITKMGNYWANAGAMGSSLANGEINADNALSKTDEWNAGLNNSGL